MTRRVAAATVAALLAGFFLLYITEGWGAGVDFDSVLLLSCADSLRMGKGFFLYTERPFVYWPPLLPAASAFLSLLLGTDPYRAASILQILFYSLTAFFLVLYTLSVFRSKTAALLTSAALLLTLRVVEREVVISTEAPFILFSISFLFFLSLYFEQQKASYLLAAELSACFASLSRYIGVVFPLTGAFLLFAKGERKKAFFFAAASSLPLALWLVRNFLVSFTFTGWRRLRGIGPFKSLPLFLESLEKDWVFSLPVFSAFLLLAVYYGLKKKELKPALVAATAALFYLIFLLLACFLVSFPERAYPRFFMPFMVLFLIGVLIIADRSFSSDRLLRILLSGVLLVWTGLHMADTLRQAKEWRSRGTSSIISFKGSAFVGFIKKRKLSCRVFSNSPPAYYFYTKRKANFVPLRKYSVQHINKGACLVWFRGLGDPARYSLQELKAKLVLKEIFRDRRGLVAVVQDYR